jgi:hypothetical protein
MSSMNSVEGEQEKLLGSEEVQSLFHRNIWRQHNETHQIVLKGEGDC